MTCKEVPSGRLGAFFPALGESREPSVLSTYLFFSGPSAARHLLLQKGPISLLGTPRVTFFPFSQFSPFLRPAFNLAPSAWKRNFSPSRTRGPCFPLGSPDTPVVRDHFISVGEVEDIPEAPSLLRWFSFAVLCSSRSQHNTKQNPRNFSESIPNRPFPPSPSNPTCSLLFFVWDSFFFLFFLEKHVLASLHPMRASRSCPYNPLLVVHSPPGSSP